MNQRAQYRNVKTIIIVMPVGIPGMGKSTTIETQIRPYFEAMSDHVNFVTFASDKIRAELVEEEQEKNRRAGIKKTRDQIFQDTGRKAVQAFF